MRKPAAEPTLATADREAQVEENRGAEAACTGTERRAHGRGRCAVQLQRAVGTAFEPERRRPSGPGPIPRLHCEGGAGEQRGHGRRRIEPEAQRHGDAEGARERHEHRRDARGEGRGRQFKGQAGVCRR